MRQGCMGHLIASGRDTAWKVREALKAGLHLALFMDRHQAGGIDVTFFGRRCKANPMVARLARHFECPIHGARVIRLPGHRFRAELTEELAPPRDRDGLIDVAATTQMIATIVEGWVREHPEQWLWLHRRWR